MEPIPMPTATPVRVELQWDKRCTQRERGQRNLQKRCACRHQRRSYRMRVNEKDARDRGCCGDRRPRVVIFCLQLSFSD